MSSKTKSLDTSKKNSHNNLRQLDQNLARIKNMYKYILIKKNSFLSLNRKTWSSGRSWQGLGQIDLKLGLDSIIHSRYIYI